MEPTEIVEGPSGVLVAARNLGRARMSSIEVGSDVHAVWRVRGGRIERFEYFGDDRAAALAAAGLAE